MYSFVLHRQLDRMKIEHPNKQVALVTFGSTVYLWGDCQTGLVAKSFSDNILNEYDNLIAAGQEYATTMELAGLESTHRFVATHMHYYSVL